MPRKPESILRAEWKRNMEAQGWYVKAIPSNQYSSGLPDCVCFHKIFGTKWVEFKTPSGKLRSTQKAVFLRMHRAGAQIYVVTDAKDTQSVHREPNWLDHHERMAHMPRMWADLQRDRASKKEN